MTTRRTTSTMTRECADCASQSQGDSAACDICNSKKFQYRCRVCQVVAADPRCRCASSPLPPVPPPEPVRAKRVPPKPPRPEPVPSRWSAAEAVRVPAFGLQLMAIFNLLLALPVALMVPADGPTRFAFYAGLCFLIPYSLLIAIGAWRLRELEGPHWPRIGAFLGVWAVFVWSPFCILGYVGTLSTLFCMAGWLVSAICSGFAGYCMILLRRPDVRRAIGARD